MMNLDLRLPKDVWIEIIEYTSSDGLCVLARTCHELYYEVWEHRIRLTLMNTDLTITIDMMKMRYIYKPFNSELKDQPRDEKINRIINNIKNLMVSLYADRELYHKEFIILRRLGSKMA